MSLIGYEGSTPALEDDAKGILSLVWNCYPGHNWKVTCKPGLIFIQDLQIDAPYGIAIKVREFEHDPGMLKKKIIMGVGELLERAGKRRGRADADQEVTHVEGLPAKWQPSPQSDLTAQEMQVAIASSERETRDQVMPQVSELLKNGD